MATDLKQMLPETLPLTLDQYRLLVNSGQFDRATGQIELINGKIVRTNPQGPFHSDPIAELARWSYEVAADAFRIRIEKPIEFSELDSCPEPDIVWATRRRYADRHPRAEDIHLLIEVSYSSKKFDAGEKLKLYARAGIKEYWLVDVSSQSIEVFSDPDAGEFRKSTVYPAKATVSPVCLPQAKLEIARLFSETV